VARFLFVVPPLAGHVNPTVAVGRQLEARGHAVAWTGHPEVVRPLLPPGLEFIPVDESLPGDVVDAVATKAPGLRGPAALKFLWEDFLIPLGHSMLPGVRASVDGFGPDVLVVDQQAIAGAAVALRRGLRWATSATTSAELCDPLRTMPRVAEWIRGLLRDFLAVAGVQARLVASEDPRFSPHLVVAFTTEALVGPVERFPAHYAFVGPSIDVGRDRGSFPWAWLDDDLPLVLVSLGTVNAPVGERFFGVAAEALGTMGVQGVVAAPPALVHAPPPNVLVAERVPQTALLERTSAVVSHAGHNTVCETLAHGLPVVLAPIRDDQPIVADQVVAAGAGVRVKFGRVGAEQLRAAIAAVLTDPGYRAAARRVRDSFLRAGGAPVAADRLVALAENPTHTRRKVEL
jgi:MGT family glycosyltransferase